MNISTRRGMPLHAGHFLVIVLALTLSFAASAQAPSPADVDRAAQESARILREQEQQERQRRESEALKRQRPSGEAPALSPPPPAEVGGERKCVDVKSLELVGATRLTAAEIAEVEKKVVGKCVTLAMINELLAAITNIYAGHGYITTRAYIPPQDLNSGVLRVVVLEGLVERIDIQPPGSASAATAFPGLAGNILNLRDFEQGIDQINRLSSNSAKIDVRPGDTPGGSVVVVNNDTKKRWSGHFLVDNSGSKSTGQDQGAVSLSVDNLMGANDSLILSHRQNLGDNWQTRMSRSDSVSLALPYGYWLGTLSYTDFAYRSLVQGQVLAFLSKGDSQTASFRADRVIYRDQADKLTVSTTLTRKANHNYIADLLIATSSRVLTVLDIDANLSRIAGGKLVSLDFGISRGLPILGGMSDPDGTPEVAAHAGFSKFKFGLSVSGNGRLAAQDINWSSALTAQYARQVLFPSEQILVTGPYAVRGFLRGSQAGDSGYYWRNEVGFPMNLQSGQTQISLRPYVAVDIGAVKEKHGVPGGQAGGWTLGCNASDGALSFQTFYSQGYLRSGTQPFLKDHFFSARLILSY